MLDFGIKVKIYQEDDANTNTKEEAGWKKYDFRPPIESLQTFTFLEKVPGLD